MTDATLSDFKYNLKATKIGFILRVNAISYVKNGRKKKL